MKSLIILIAVLFLSSFSFQSCPQENEFIRKEIQYYFPEKIDNPVSNPLPIATYTVGDGGYFITLDSAFNKLSIDGIEGEIILELVDELYTAPAGKLGFVLYGPIPGAGPDSRIILKPALGKNVTIEGNGMGVLCFFNTSYLTINGNDIDGATTLKIHSLKNSEYDWNDGIAFINGSKHNIVQDITLECEDYLGLGCGIVFAHESGPLTPDSNLIQNNFIKKAAMGISILSKSYRPLGNIIHGNKIGSDKDSLISRGINLTLCKQTVVENNIVQNIRNNISLVCSPGIVSLAGVGDIIRNNVIFNVKVNEGEYGGIGIFLNGITGYQGVINSVYNNMVYNIQSSSLHDSAKVSGIGLRNQSYPKVYNNSVYLDGKGSNRQGSAALYIGLGCTQVNVKNNILVNNRDESPYCASAIHSYSTLNFLSDYNDLYCIEIQENWLVRIGFEYYKILAEWQSTGNDIHSYSEMPNFADPYLHVNSSFSTYLESGGIPIGGITTDIDLQLRDPITPDIGADEFDGNLSMVEHQSLSQKKFTLEQNYPNPFNPSTTIKYSIPSAEFVTLKVYDVLGNEVATLVNEDKPAGGYEVEFSAAELSSGIYFYKLQVGSFIETKKMLLMK